MFTPTDQTWVGSVSNADTKADVARDDHEDVPPLSTSSQTDHFIKWKRAIRYTALLHEAGCLLLGLVSLATVTGLYFWLDVPLVAAAFTYLVVLVLLSLASNLSLIFLSFIGVGCLSYFFAPPIYSFRVDYPQDLVTISAFMITSFVVNVLVTRVRAEQRDHMRAQGALRESERSARSAIDGIAGRVVILAPNGEVETVNRQVFEYFGRSLEWLKNWGTNDAVHPEDLPRVLELVKRAMASGIPFNYELRMRRFDGEYRWFDDRGVPIRDDTGRIAHWCVLLTDIEDRTRALARLERMRSDFAHMNRVSMMGELAASLSHEITQPIASARNNARAAQNFMDKQPPDLSEVRVALSCVVGDADRAGDIVDRIRDHIKKTPPRKEHFDLNEAINEVILLGRSAVIKNGVSVQTRLSEGLFPIHCDRVQLQQVVLNLNLILNAAESMGSVEAEPRDLLISTEQHQTGVLVAVRDSGPGIDPTHLERVFDAFYTTKSRGLGMGLSICRSIIDAHGGRLWAEVNEPHGSIFQFTLPGVQVGS
jgi:PAS domain S-box-containing protein